MAESPRATLQVPQRGISDPEEVKRQEAFSQKHEQQDEEPRKLTNKEFWLIVLIVLLTVVICCLVGFILGWFLWPRDPDGYSQPAESGGNSREEPFDYNPMNQPGNKSTSTEPIPDVRRLNVTTCLTPGCLMAGLYLLNKLDNSVDPCRDFKSYACGRKDNAIFPKSASLSNYDILKEKSDVKFLTLLQSRVGRIGSQSSERKVKQFFKTCTNTSKMWNEQRNSVLKHVQALGGWPAIGMWNRDDVRNWRLSIRLEYLQLTLGVEAFFSWAPVPDFDDSSRYIIKLSPSGLTLPDRKLYQGNYSDPILMGFRKFLRTSALLLGASGKPVNRFVADVFAFEKKLAKIPISADLSYRKVSIRELIVTAPEIDWRNFFRQFPEIELTTEIWVDDLDYFKSVSQLLSASYPRIMQNYLVWRYIYSISPYLSGPYRDGFHQLHRLSTGEAALDRDHDCLTLTRKYFDLALQALVLRDDPMRMARKKVKHMVSLIREEFVKSIERVRWMDEETKQSALKKAVSLRINVGFPEFIKNTRDVDNYFTNHTISDDQTMVEMLANVNRGNVLNMMKMTSETVDSNRYTWAAAKSPMTSYDPSTNSIVIPASLFQAPVFEQSYPASFNFGSLGSEIGKQVLQAVTGTGTNFDEEGNYSPWWTNTTNDGYEREITCLSQMLGADGTRNDTESFSQAVDIGGMILSYQAWLMDLTNQEDIIPGVNLTSKQAFFVTYAQSQCESSASTGIYKAMNKLDLFGLKEFGQVFKCIPEPPTVLDESCSLL